MKTCAACSMPLGDEKFIALERGDDVFCIYCVDEHQNVKSCEDIFEGGVQYFVNEENVPRAYAEKLTRKNMSMLPHWKGDPSPCLKGEMLTDEEFQSFFAQS